MTPTPPGRCAKPSDYPNKPNSKPTTRTSAPKTKPSATGTTTPLRNQRKNQSHLQRNRPTNQPTHRLGNHTRPQHGPQHHHTTNTQTLPTRTPTRTHHHQPIQPRLQHLHKHRQNPQNHDDTDFNLVIQAAHYFANHNTENMTPRMVPIPGFSAKWLGKTTSNRCKAICKLLKREQLALNDRHGEIRLRLLDTQHHNQPDLIVTQPWTDARHTTSPTSSSWKTKTPTKPYPQQNTPSAYSAADTR